MPQFLVSPNVRIGDVITLSEKESHHILRVFHKKTGETLSLTDGAGKRFTGRIVRVDADHKVCVEILEQKEEQKASPLFVAQALLKGEKMEWVLKKSAELGVHTFLPFYSTHTVSQWKGNASSSKLTRWRKLSEEVSKQCGRSTHMKLEEPVSLSQILQTTQAKQKILFWEKATLRLRDIEQSDSQLVILGPEGGFSEKEIKEATQNNCIIASLGSLILRAETATLAAISILQYELGNI